MAAAESLKMMRNRTLAFLAQREGTVESDCRAASPLKPTALRDDTQGLTRESKPVTFVVRRGALRRFDRLKTATKELGAEVVWDRRGQARPRARAAEQTAPEAEDRRKGTSATWELADFVVSEAAVPQPRPAARPKKSS